MTPGTVGPQPDESTPWPYDRPPSSDTPDAPSRNPYASYAPNDYGSPPSGTAPGPIPGPMPGGAFPYGYGYVPGYAPGYAGPMLPATSGWAIASLICSIAGWLGFWFVGHLLGVIFGHLALREIAASEGRIEGRGLATAGLVVGYIGLGLTVLCVVGFVLLFIIIGIFNH